MFGCDNRLALSHGKDAQHLRFRCARMFKAQAIADTPAYISDYRLFRMVQIEENMMFISFR